MNKQALLQEIYESAFNDELEKNAGIMDNVLKGGKIVAKRLWNIGGNTKGLSEGIIRNYDKARQPIMHTVNKLNSNMSDIGGTITNMSKDIAKGTSKVDKLKNRGLIEKILGGRLGTQARRQANRRKEILSLRSQKSSLRHTKRRQGIIADKIKEETSRITPSLNWLAAKKNIGLATVGARNLATTAGRVGIVGGTGYVGYKGVKAVRNRTQSQPSQYSNYQQQYY